MPAQAGIQLKARHSGEGRPEGQSPWTDFVIQWLYREIVLVPLAAASVRLLFRQKSPKPSRAGMTISPTSCRLDYPALLADRAPARTPTSM